jgi:tripeptidyl-peptidase-1
MIPHNSTVLEPEQAALVPSYTYSSHGGFSNYFPRPSWQSAAVKEWADKHNPGYKTYVADSKASNIGQGGGLYNRAGRAYPDISANSARIGLVINEKVEPGFGTSYASPIWAAVISFINQERSAAGKSPVGFINPVLYSHPSAMNDIVGGTNPGCGTQGFEAVEGWDPV